MWIAAGLNPNTLNVISKKRSDMINNAFNKQISIKGP